LSCEKLSTETGGVGGGESVTDKSLSILLKIVEKRSKANRDQLNEEKIWTEREKGKRRKREIQ
jgi:hypothetical protein